MVSFLSYKREKPVCIIVVAYLYLIRLFCVPWWYKKAQRRACIDSHMLSTCALARVRQRGLTRLWSRKSSGISKKWKSLIIFAVCVCCFSALYSSVYYDTKRPCCGEREPHTPGRPATPWYCSIEKVLLCAYDIVQCSFSHLRLWGC